MIKTLLAIFLLSQSLAAHSQIKAKDVFASAPDTIFPLLTTNNRLDCIDLIENGREAIVKNRLEQKVTMTALSDTYLQIKPSARSIAEIKVLNDSLFCLINTYMGPAPDSHISFYTADWTPVSIAFKTPAVSDFWTALPDSVQRDADYARRMQEDIPLIQISAEKDSKELTLTLQTSELPGKEREMAKKYVQPLRYRWTGKGLRIKTDSNTNRGS